MANIQYIGARYVPIIYTNPDDNSANWKSGVKYEALTIVTYNGDSYTSKKTVPDLVGDPASNPDYWVKTGDFNASLLALQQRVNRLDDVVGDDPLETEAQDLTNAVNELNVNKPCVTPKMFGAKGDGATDDTIAIQSAVDYAHANGLNVVITSGTYIISNVNNKFGIVPRANVDIIGVGNPTLKLNSAACNIISNFSEDWETSTMSSVKNVVITGITFDGNGDILGDPYAENPPYAADNYSLLVYIIRAENITVKNCHFKNAYYGGINLFSCKNTAIIKNTFEHIGRYADAHYPNYSAIGADSGASNPTRNATILHNIVNNCGSVCRINSGNDYGQGASCDNIEIGYNYSNDTIGGIAVFAGIFRNVNIHDNEITEIKQAAINCAPANTDTLSSYFQNLKIVNNLIQSLDAVSESNKFLICVSTIDNLIFTGNTVIHMHWNTGNNVILVIRSVNNDFALGDINAIFKDNTFIVSNMNNFISTIPNNMNVDFEHNVISVGYFTGKLFDFEQTLGSNIVTIKSNDFSGVSDRSKFNTNTPKELIVRDNENIVTEIAEQLTVSDGTYYDVPITNSQSIASALITPVLDNAATPIFVASFRVEGRNRMIFKIKDLDGNGVSNAKINYYVKGSLYDLVTTP